MSLVRLIIDSNGTTEDFKSQCPLYMGGLDAATNFASYIEGLTGGALIGASLQFAVGAVGASATFTVGAGGSANGEEGTLLNTPLLAVTSGANPEDGEFNISATGATQAASMVLAIEAVLGDKVSVSRNGAVVTVTSKVPGSLGDGLEISAGDLANVTVSQFSGGLDGTSYIIDMK